MAILIKGIRLHNLFIGLDEEGKEKITAGYQLLTDQGNPIGSKETLSTGKGYNENTFQPSPQTVVALKEAASLYKKDVEMSLGLTVS